MLELIRKPFSDDYELYEDGVLITSKIIFVENHTKVVHDALGIDADTVDGEHVLDLENSAINWSIFFGG